MNNQCKMSLVKRNLATKITNTRQLFICPEPTTETQNKDQSCPNLTIKITARRQWRRSGVFFAKLEHAPHLAPVSPSPKPNMQLPAGYLRLELILLRKYSKQ